MWMRRQSDIIKWTPANVTRDAEGKRVIKHRQNKTDVVLKIGLTPEVERMIDQAIGPVPVLHQTIVHNRDGEQYTYSGIHSMLKAQIKRLNEKCADDGLPPIQTFGFRDLKGKGATDMWLAGVPIEQIQMLRGHKDKNTTEIYIKAR